ncbi:DUF4468 domain-containing protein [Elizabethkingia anophelis]|uniref:DUF4468 domain-containing protein n=1 Tax=Elizabethkingia anophelis TaxID=1117645 RepID=A0A494J4V6_9FLAO|nr:DUF4468 domain-containing protein [Elizabethkingia anophelis]AQX50630.1 hypothetical protein AYC66_08060 [Elizabethkingia anophelis]MDV3645063.1 DUF4468 domain-containing protein [Elizabethkingia anophelis]MDV3684784.1 DUF4468 domain-containing protein [Elizabethkingia anophelis]MDV3737964.1 DUF4468 domain-containing protein [Elizabethkingia anophelis]MDV3916987.1 DUF4468 domain-containing protein [Elizabethkingia anophelis]
MKKLLLFLTLSTIFINAQSFKLSPDGIINEKDTAKNYIVLDFADKSQAELFKATRMYLQKQFNSPDNVISIVDNDQIVVNAVAKYAVSNLDYTYQDIYTFKDGKIKYQPTIKYLQTNSNYSSSKLPYRGFDGIYNDNGQLNRENLKEPLENYLNTKVILIKQGIQKELTGNNF